MRLKQFGLCLIVMFSLLSTGAASAASINFLPSDNIYNLNETFSVLVVVSDLDPGEVVSAFDLDVNYNSSVLMATDVLFTENLGSLDPFAFETFTGSDIGNPGVVSFDELSVLSDPDLLAIQPNDSVLIATLSFLAIGIGSSDLIFDPSTLPLPGVIDVKGNNFALLDLDTVGQGSVTINDISEVPIPGAALLMFTGLFGIGIASRKRKSKA